MVFSDPSFLFLFLPAVIFLSLLLRRERIMGFLIIASLLFYYIGNGAYILILFYILIISYYATLYRFSGPALAAAIVAIVMPIVIIKYCGFFARNLGLDVPDWLHFATPAGISFFTFQALSFIFDYRKREKPLPSLADYLHYKSFFPLLIAGPIVRYRQVEDAIPVRGIAGSDLSTGLVIFTWGLAKKVLVADSLSPMVDAVFATPPAELSTAAAWLGAVGYAIQLYFDFSGYSDMAIGIARIFGWRIPDNFNRPYSAVSVTDFWRRWHISLSSWFRDYVYIPLGGNRVSAWRAYLNLWIVFLLTGLWHGAGWTFVFWGAAHGLALTVERFFGVGHRPWAPAAVQRAITLVIVLLLWVPFRSPDMNYALAFWGRMFRFDGAVPAFTPDVALAFDTAAAAMLVVGMATFFFPASFQGAKAVVAATGRNAVAFALPAALIGASCLFALSSQFVSFLYFNF